MFSLPNRHLHNKEEQHKVRERKPRENPRQDGVNGVTTFSFNISHARRPLLDDRRIRPCKRFRIPPWVDLPLTLFQSGGAGIQADLKTFTSLQSYGMSVLTALTAQNTLAVQAVHPIPPEFVVEQVKIHKPSLFSRPTFTC